MRVQRLTATCSTAVELLDAVAEAYPEREAFVDGEKRLTYSGWWEAAQGVAAAMVAAGVGHGDVVCLALPSSIEYAICYQAAMRLGAITSGLNTRLGPLESPQRTRT